VNENSSKFRDPKPQDLRRLSRSQLLELLLRQTKRVEELEAALAQAEKKLRERRIAELEAGSIAEAALKLSGVFEAAQAAADQYLENVKALANKNTEAEHTEDKQDES
jgi:hypothetical protein